MTEILSPEILVVIDTGFACAAIIVHEDRVSYSAPILRRWFMGKTVEQVKDICMKRNWKILRPIDWIEKKGHFKHA